jgi:HEAT repeat protein
LIVLVIVAIWVMFNWLVHRSAMRPEELIQGMQQGPRVARWQRASELADMLRNERFAEFKRDANAATQLARILDRENESAGQAGGIDEGDVMLRYFLARALGEFEVHEGVDVLLETARTNRDPAEQLVRHGALEAIAVRTYNLSQLDPPRELAHPELESTLFELARDEDPLIRSKTAYALGQIGTPAAIERLAAVANDPHADTRYNAAVALAHHGNSQAIETLAEMLDLEEPASVLEEKNSRDQAGKRAVIFHNALTAVEALARQQPEADFSLVIESLEAVAEADEESLAKARIPARLAEEAKRVLAAIRPHD